jgi:hypothetical protein
LPAFSISSGVIDARMSFSRLAAVQPSGDRDAGQHNQRGGNHRRHADELLVALGQFRELGHYPVCQL